MAANDGRKWLVALVGLVLVAFVGVPDKGISAEKSRAAMTPKQLLNLIDDNKDGRIDRAEFSFKRMELLYLRDINRDDRLDKTELPSVGVSEFNAADIDHDGTLSGYEFNQAGFARFETLDRNRDGFITLAEIRSYVEGMK